MATRNSIKKVSAEKMAAGVYAATFNNGTVVEFDVRKVAPDFDNLPDMAKKFLSYGVKQKLDDSMADADGNVDTAIEELTSTIQCIEAGQWSTRVAGEGEGGSLFARALAKFKECSLGEAKAIISGLVEKSKALDANKDVSERAINNAIRQTMLAKYPALAATYEELRKARESKVSSKIQIALDD